VIDQVQTVLVRIRCSKENLPGYHIILFNFDCENDWIPKSFLGILFCIECSIDIITALEITEGGRFLDKIKSLFISIIFYRTIEYQENVSIKWMGRSKTPPFFCRVNR
jgi:hypothetical protein